MALLVNFTIGTKWSKAVVKFNYGQQKKILKFFDNFAKLNVKCLEGGGENLPRLNMMGGGVKRNLTLSKFFLNHYFSNVARGSRAFHYCFYNFRCLQSLVTHIESHLRPAIIDSE